MPTAPSAKLRVVLDTNLYISAFTHPRGPAFQVWKTARERRYLLLVSPAIIREVAAVLREQFAWEEEQVARRVKLVAKLAVLECAVAGKADLVVSGDQHLRRLKIFQGIPIVSPRDLLRTLGMP